MTSNDRWEDIGRDLLAEQLELMRGDVLRDAFLNAQQRIERGEELTQADIRELRRALEEADRLVNIVAEASPETSPPPTMWEFLDEDARHEYLQEAERRLTETDQEDDGE
jgi:hypothetical protein